MTRCPHCIAGVPSVWDGELEHWAHAPEDAEVLLVCDEPWAPRKPCLRRLSHPDVSRYETSTTWCTRPEGHAGNCAGPEPTILVPNRFGPADSQRRRW